MKINIASIDFKHWMINFINISGVDFADQKEEPTPASSSMYFTLEEGQTEATISYSNTYQSLHNKNLQFSYDDQNWEDWTGAKTIYAGEKLYVRGLDDYVLNDQVRSNNAFFSISQGYVECHGNIMSLCNNSNIIKGSSFYSLFRGNSYLKTAPDIIADEVEPYGCYQMFNSCSNLKSIDKIDVKKVGDHGFSKMLNSCSSLVNIPSILPATELANYCYSDMFIGCRSLVQAPELPATTLAKSCYSYMFTNCTSLTQVPSILPATTLEEGCYWSMFQGCSSLTKAPELPATTLKYNCYNSMFSSCYSLTQAPSILPATTLANHCYMNMFSDCSKLTQAPELPATRLGNACYYAMFRNCTSLTQAPELPATTLAESCYSQMFYGCTSLVRAPYLPASQLAGACYSEMFYSCYKLSYIKAGFLNGTANDLSNWVRGVSATGVYEKPVSSEFNERGGNGIPEGWTIKTYQP